MRTLTITEFLEARIAEDEHHSNRELLWGTTPNWTKAHARVLAECAAKRAVVEAAVNCETYGDQVVVLRALASAYKDHADYDQEWAL